MKRLISILSIAAAVLSLFASTVMPHHHHCGTVCVIAAVCECAHGCGHECGDQDRHEAHGEGHGDACVAESKFIVPHSNDDIKCRISSCDNHDHNHIWLFPLFFLAADPLYTDKGSPVFETGYGERLLFYKSAQPGRIHGLRAPPAGLS